MATATETTWLALTPAIAAAADQYFAAVADWRRFRGETRVIQNETDCRRLADARGRVRKAQERLNHAMPPEQGLYRTRYGIVGRNKANRYWLNLILKEDGAQLVR